MSPGGPASIILQPSVHDEGLDRVQRQRAEHFDRLAGDIELYNRIKWAQYEGRDYEAFRDALAAYALPVLIAWCRSGRIFRECAEKGRRVGSCEIDRDVAPDLAADTTVDALARFRDDVLIPHQWDPGRGASLRTYFVGACVLAFPNVFRQWQRGEGANVLSRAAEHDPDDLLLPPPFRDPGFWMDLDHAVRTVGGPSARLLLGKVQGHTNRELADQRGVSVKTVEARLRKLSWRR